MAGVGPGLLNDEIKARARTNLVQSHSFAAMLEAAIRQNQNRSIETVQVIAELIELAHALRAARELAETIRQNATIDWTLKESARARLRLLVKRLLRKYGYPPDKQERATQTVLEQAELLAGDWATTDGDIIL